MYDEFELRKIVVPDLYSLKRKCLIRKVCKNLALKKLSLLPTEV